MSLAEARVITAEEVLEAISPQRAIDVVERAFVAMAKGHVRAPKAMTEPLAEGTVHVKTCAGEGGDFANLFVAKINANFPANLARRGLPTIQGAILAFDATCGKLLAVIDSGSVTSLRTAATTAVALRHLARERSRVATIIGCGAQGESHLSVLPHVLSIEKVFLFDTDPARAQALASRAERMHLPLEVKAVPDFAAATRQSDVVITCTSSKTPFLEAQHVEPGTVVAAVGADNEWKAEIGESLLKVARIVTDQTAQCLKSGDLRRVAGQRSGARDQWLELSQAVANHCGRVGQSEVVVFDSTGLAVEDLAIVAELLDSPIRQQDS